MILETLASVPLVTWCQLWFGEVWNTIFQHRPAVLHSPPFTAWGTVRDLGTGLQNLKVWSPGLPVVFRRCFEMDLENSWSPFCQAHISHISTLFCQVVDWKCIFFHILSARRGDSAEVLWLCRCFVQDQGPPWVQWCGKLQLCSARTLGASQHCPS